jgi:hypothetical protein
VSGDEDGGQNGGGLDPLVVVRVDADVLLLRRERELTHLQRLQLVVRLQVRPPPHPTVDHVRQALTVGDLTHIFTV